MNLTKLTSTTRLLLVTIVGTGHLRDGFTIWDLRFLIINLDLLIVLHTPLQGAQVELTLTMNDDLAQLLRLLNDPCGIFLAHLLEGCHHLFSLSLVDGLDGTRELGVRIFDEIELIIYILGVQRVAGLHVLQLHRTADITSTQLVNLNTVSTSTGIQRADTLLRATISVGQVVTTLHDTTHHLEILYLTDVRLDTRLEEIE